MNNAERRSAFSIVHSSFLRSAFARIRRDFMKPRFVLTLLAVAALSLPAAAQEHEAVALSPFAGDLGNAVWTLSSSSLS